MNQSAWTLLSFGEGGWGREFASGLLLTLEVSFASYCLSFLLGLAGAAAKLSSNRIWQGLAGAYTTIVRALPELLLILLLYYAVAQSAQRGLQHLGLVGPDFQFSPFIAAVVALGFVSGAFMTEVIRAAYLTIPKGQIEAAMAVGMGRPTMLRLIVLPQMLRIALPGMSNLWLSITKESALISVLGSFHELLYVGYRAAANTKQYILFYGVTGGLFLAITLVSVLAIKKLEKHLNRGHG